jgi:hypothetical protein
LKLKEYLNQKIGRTGFVACPSDLIFTAIYYPTKLKKLSMSSCAFAKDLSRPDSSINSE